MDQKIHTAINWLDRDQILGILESIGIQCYDSESDDYLRDVIRENIEDGTLRTSGILCLLM